MPGWNRAPGPRSPLNIRKIPPIDRARARCRFLDIRRMLWLETRIVAETPRWEVPARIMIDTDVLTRPQTEISSAGEYTEDAEEALEWADRRTAAAILKAAHLFHEMAESGHSWDKDPNNARQASAADRGREAALLKQAARRAAEAGWPEEISERLQQIAESILAETDGSPPPLPSDDKLHAKHGAHPTPPEDEISHPWERFISRIGSFFHISRNYEHHDIKSARDHRRALLQARRAEQQGFDGAIRAAKIYERMATCGHAWEKNKDLAKSHGKDDQRAQGYSLFAAAQHAESEGRPFRDVLRLYSRAYGVLTEAGEPEPDLRVWLWPDGGEDARFNLMLARCYLKMGRKGEAERRAERAIWQKLIDAPYLSSHDRAVIENMGLRLLRDDGISGIDC